MSRYTMISLWPHRLHLTYTRRSPLTTSERRFRHGSCCPHMGHFSIFRTTMLLFPLGAAHDRRGNESLAVDAAGGAMREPPRRDRAECDLSPRDAGVVAPHHHRAMRETSLAVDSVYRLVNVCQIHCYLDLTRHRLQSPFLGAALAKISTYCQHVTVSICRA